MRKAPHARATVRDALVATNAHQVLADSRLAVPVDAEVSTNSVARLHSRTTGTRPTGRGGSACFCFDLSESESRRRRDSERTATNQKRALRRRHGRMVPGGADRVAADDRFDPIVSRDSASTRSRRIFGCQDRAAASCKSCLAAGTGVSRRSELFRMLRDRQPLVVAVALLRVSVALAMRGSSTASATPGRCGSMAKWIETCCAQALVRREVPEDDSRLGAEGRQERQCRKDPCVLSRPVRFTVSGRARRG